MSSRRVLTELNVLIRGAGEMASGVAHRLFESHLRVAMTEQPEPQAVRRMVSFCEAVWDGVFEIEGVRSRRVEDPARFNVTIDKGEIPILVDPSLSCLQAWRPQVLCDATMTKRKHDIRRHPAEWVIGLGPGFEAGVSVDVVVETNRGHDLGRVMYRGTAEPDTGVPGPVMGHTLDRVLRAPCCGVLEATSEIGDRVEPGQLVARVEGQEVRAAVGGVLRGLLRPGVYATQGLKIGDIDPRGDPRHCYTISDKARALGGSVLEAILAKFNA